MSLDAQSFAFTKLLAQASTQHLRLTLEPLPVGLIEITEEGIIESIDESTALKLGFALNQLQGRSITMIVDDCASDLLELLKSKRYGSLFQAAFRTETGRLIVAEMVLEPALQSHKFVCNVIFTTDNMFEEELDPGVLDAIDELGGSTTQLDIRQSQTLSSFEIIILFVLVALIVFFFVATTSGNLDFGF